jgi:hypothetical protein
MGYTTEFDGSVSISPPYFVDGSGPFGQGHDDDDRWRLVVTGNIVTSVRAN